MSTLSEITGRAFGRSTTSDFGRLVQFVRDTIAVWQHRACSRAHLGTLDDHLLNDIGLDRAQVEAELDKPFWRA